MNCAKTAKPIEMPLFGLWARVGPRKHVLHGVHTGAIWRIRLNRPCAAAMRHFCQINLITRYHNVAVTTANELSNSDVLAWLVTVKPRQFVCNC